MGNSKNAGKPRLTLHAKGSEDQPIHNEASNPRQYEHRCAGKQPAFGLLLGFPVNAEVDQKPYKASRQQPDRRGVYAKPRAYGESGYRPA